MNIYNMNTNTPMDIDMNTDTNMDTVMDVATDIDADNLNGHNTEKLRSLKGVRFKKKTKLALICCNDSR
jgi:hypothetical protein